MEIQQMEIMESLTSQTIEANETHKNALDTYTKQLEAELREVDKLIAAVEDLPDDEPREDPGDKWCLHVEGAFKPVGIVDFAQTRHGKSPFYEEALRRDRYIKATVPNPFSNAEKRYLEKAIVKENMRLTALSAKQSGRNAFEAVTGNKDFFLNNVEGIDWTTVARDVSASNSPLGSRTAQECKVRWLGAQHPKINNERWQEEEEGNLLQLVDSKTNTKIDWEEISQLLGTNRTPLECIRRYQLIRRTTFRWTKALDKKLMDAVRDNGHNNWTLVAAATSPDVSANQCQIRYTRSLDPEIKHGKFSLKEEQLLQRAVEAHGLDWIKVAQAVPGRTNVQCRDLYLQKMTGPKAKSPWTDEEDLRLRAAVEKHGTDWNKIREEMGCVRPRIQYVSRHKTLLRMSAKAVDAQNNQDAGAVHRRDATDAVPKKYAREATHTQDEREAAQLNAGEVITPSNAMESAPQTSSGGVAPISRGQDGVNSESLAIEGEEMMNVQTTEHNEIDSSKQSSAVLFPSNTSRTKDVESARPQHLPSIPKKRRPRPRPAYKIGGVATDSRTQEEDTPTISREPTTTVSPVLATEQGTRTMEASTSEPPRTQLTSSLAGELSDLTDLDDLENEPPRKKRARKGRGTASANPTRSARKARPPHD